MPRWQVRQVSTCQSFWQDSAAARQCLTSAGTIKIQRTAPRRMGTQELPLTAGSMLLWKTLRLHCRRVSIRFSHDPAASFLGIYMNLEWTSQWWKPRRWDIKRSELACCRGSERNTPKYGTLLALEIILSWKKLRTAEADRYPWPLVRSTHLKPLEGVVTQGGQEESEHTVLSKCPSFSIFRSFLFLYFCMTAHSSPNPPRKHPVSLGLHS